MVRWFRNIFWLLYGVFLMGLASCTSNPTPTAISPTSTAAPVATITQAAIPTVASTSLPGGLKIPLLGFKMVDPQTGWGWGESQVLRTSDGGQTWVNVTPKDWPSGGTFPQVATGDAHSAWVVAGDAKDFNRGKFFRTQDSGQSWQTGEVPFGNGMLQRLNEKAGFFLAGRGVAAGSMVVDLYQTSDGGSTWVLMYHIDPQAPEKNSLPFAGLKSGMSFRDAQHGWVVGSIPMEGAVYFYATADGGKTWQPQPLDLPAGLKDSQIMLSAPQFFDAKNAVLPALFYKGSNSLTVLYASQDGGATWAAGQPFNSSGREFTLNPSMIYSWEGKNLRISRDGGQTWKTIQPDIDFSNALLSFQFVDAQTGWALSNDGKTSQLYRTLDEGQTWK